MWKIHRYKEWQNPSGTSFDGGGSSLEQDAWVPATQRQEKFSINNQQLFIGMYLCNNIFNIFIERNYHLIIQSAYSFPSSHQSPRDRKRTCNMNRDMLAATQSSTPVTLPKELCGFQLNCQILKWLLSQLINFWNSLIFIYSKILYIISSVMQSHRVIASSHYDHTCPQLSVFILPRSNLWQDMNLFYLYLVFLSRDNRCHQSSVCWCMLLTFPIFIKDFS